MGVENNNRRGYGCPLQLYWGYVGIMEKEMETTMKGLGLQREPKVCPSIVEFLSLPLCAVYTV